MGLYYRGYRDYVGIYIGVNYYDGVLLKEDVSA